MLNNTSGNIGFNELFRSFLNVSPLPKYECFNINAVEDFECQLQLDFYKDIQNMNS